MTLKLVKYIQITLVLLSNLAIIRCLENGLKILFSESSNAYLQGRTEFSRFVQKFSFENYYVDKPRISTFKDVVPDSFEVCHQTEVTAAGVPVHLASQISYYNTFKRLNRHFGVNTEADMNYFQFPRFRHFSRKLPELTLEPYQRLMSFAIEVCMIPSIWYLELIHCMYIGMAPFFEGVLMSYSLQDVVGTAIKTMGYLDESFSIENCYHSVLKVADDKISVYYEDICSKMKSCLDTSHFSNEPFLRLKNEFERRIKNVYSSIDASRSTDEFINYARLSLLTALSLKEINLDLEYGSTEVNFLPVRAMMISLTYILNVSLPKIEYPMHKRFKKISKLLRYLLYNKIDHFILYCTTHASKIYSDYHMDLRTFRELYCMEILSIGFIKEEIKLAGDNLEKLKNAVMPTRILDPSYIQFIPSMDSNSSKSDDFSWLNYVSTSKIDYITFQKSTVEKSSVNKRMYRKTASESSISGPKTGNLKIKKRSRLSRFTRRLSITKKKKCDLINGNLGLIQNN